MISLYNEGLPAVITLTAYFPYVTTDDVPIPEACRKLEEAGAAVVGLNCARGPATMLPLIRDIRKVCKVNMINEIIWLECSKCPVNNVIYILAYWSSEVEYSDRGIQALREDLPVHVILY